MASDSDNTESYKKINTILVSQPEPERSPYFDISDKWGINIDWRPFIHVEGVPEKEFRKNRLRLDDFSAVIFSSKNAIEHFFRMSEEMGITMSQQTKYFCLTESIANYLQKFIVYRKRKVFVGKRLMDDLTPAFNKHKENENFLLPCSNLGAKSVVRYLDANKIDYQEAMMYKTVSSDLSDLENITYDCLIFFSPLGITSLFDNFPDFKQKETRIAVYGKTTTASAEKHGLKVNILAPTPDSPSMSMALSNYITKANK